MKCQKCQKNNATTHYSQYINGTMTEYYLCSKCAEEMGIGSMFSGFDPFAGLFSAFAGFPQTYQPLKETEKCSTCGCGLDDIVNSGKVGCVDCYRTFSEQLRPLIERLHGRAIHTGKRPGRSAASTKSADSKEHELSALRQKLAQAISAQEYEQAAVYRDQIKALESGQ